MSLANRSKPEFITHPIFNCPHHSGGFCSRGDCNLILNQVCALAVEVMVVRYSDSTGNDDISHRQPK